MKVEEFNRTIAAWPAEAVRDHGVPLQRDVLTDLLDGVVDGTPVGGRLEAQALPRGAGHAKANWSVTLHRTYSATERPGADPTGATTKAQGAAVIGGIHGRPVDYATIANPVPYMDALANGYSKQAPAGWIDRVVAAVTAKYGARR